MARIRKDKKRRKPRTPKLANDKTNVQEDSFYLKAVNSNNIKLLYQFIYGKKRREINLLMRGFQLLINKTNDLKEKESILSLAKLTYIAKLDAMKEKIKRFKYKTGKSLIDVVKKAKNGNDVSLLELIEFNKGYLFDLFVQERILQAEAEEDIDFLYNLGEAIKRRKGKIEDIRGKETIEQKNLRALIRCLKIARYDFTKADVAKQLMRIICKEREGFGAGFVIPDHTGTIKRTLKRMGIPIT